MLDVNTLLDKFVERGVVMEWIEILAKLGIAYLAIGGVFFLIAVIVMVVAIIKYLKE